MVTVGGESKIEIFKCNITVVAYPQNQENLQARNFLD